ncbi:MAG: hypothetical protein ABH830_04520, partial [Patescibacteria group bacterium]
MTNKNFQKGIGALSIVLIIAIALLLCSNAITIFYLYSKNKANDANKLNNISDNVIESGGENTDSSGKNGDENNESDDINEDGGIEENLVKGEIKIKWNEWPVISDVWTIFDYSNISNKIEQYNKENQYSDLTVDSYLNKFKIYKVGKVENGEYSGRDLFIITFRPEGPSFRDSMYRVIKIEKALVLLSNYSDSPWGIDEKLFTLNDKIIISNLDIEEKIIEPKTGIKLIKEESPPLELFQTLDNPKKLFEYKEGKFLYRNTKDYCFIAKANDGTFNKYYFKFNFSNKNEDNEGDIGMISFIPEITWSNGEKNIYEYVSRELGCSLSCYDYANYLNNNSDLQLAGLTNGGEKIYEFNDVNFKLDGEEDSYLKNLYDNIYIANNQDKDFEYFINNKPIIFWQDPFGNFIEFRNTEFQPQAECGKPVIYLYPEAEIDVQVYVSPSGGFTKTEPAYNNGWKVRANPDSEIYNYSDKNIYPYLFWEGYALDYERPEQGFVVKKENIKEFLEAKLLQLGLIKKEYDEFIEFWLPKMQEKNYYFITFVPREEFDKLA